MNREPSAEIYPGGPNTFAPYSNTAALGALCEPFCYSNQALQYMNGGYAAFGGDQMRLPRPSSYLTITQFHYQPAACNCPVGGEVYMPPAAHAAHCYYKNKGIDAQERLYQTASSGSSETSYIEQAFQCEDPGKAICTADNTDYFQTNASRVYTNLLAEKIANGDSRAVTQFIIDSCMKAESIAIRNQCRPCFKNIQHLCSKTRLDIWKPKSTLANIHSQGVPWVTKDFICAFVRLVNSWQILKGYLEESNENLGKIESTMHPEFKKCYYEWQKLNKRMIVYITSAFVNLDYGTITQSKEIYSMFNHEKATAPEQDLPSNSATATLAAIKCDGTELRKVKEIQKHASSIPTVPNMRGLCRLKDIFNGEDESSEDECFIQNQHAVAQRTPPPPPQTRTSYYLDPTKSNDVRDLKRIEGEIWQNAVQRCNPFIESKLHTDYCCITNTKAEFEGFAGNCSALRSPSVNEKTALPSSCKRKFKKIVARLMEAQFVKYKTFPEHLEHLNKSCFLYYIKEKLNNDKYNHPDQVVYDLKSVINKAKLQSKQRLDWRFEKCVLTFATELELQLSHYFPTSDFQHVTGESTV